jgi:hypothetical protein
MSPDLSEETRKRIEEELRKWAKADPEAQSRFEAARQEWDVELRPLKEAIVASERLTEEDFAIRINARD